MPNSPLDSLRAAGLAGSLALAAGSFLDWIVADASILHLSKSGIDGSDGWFTLALGTLAAFYFLGRSYLAGAVFCTVGALLASYEWADVKRRAATINSNPLASAKVGVGIYLCIAGAVIGGTAGYLAHSKLRNTRGHE